MPAGEAAFPLLPGTYLIPGAGRRELPPPELEFHRELAPEDAAAALAAGPEAGTPVPLGRIRAHHHLLARLLGEGRTAADCSRITGFTPSWISTLQTNPAFAELIDHYRGEVTEKYLDVHTRLAGLGASAVEELQDRLETDPNQFSVRALKEVAEMALDRSVAPPKAARGGPVVGAASGLAISINFVEPAKPVVDLGLPEWTES